MSFDRYWHWKCDICFAEKQRKESGFPKGWTFFIDQFESSTSHACKECCEEFKIKKGMVFDPRPIIPFG